MSWNRHFDILLQLAGWSFYLLSFSSLVAILAEKGFQGWKTQEEHNAILFLHMRDLSCLGSLLGMRFILFIPKHLVDDKYGDSYMFLRTYI